MKRKRNKRLFCACGSVLDPSWSRQCKTKLSCSWWREHLFHEVLGQCRHFPQTIFNGIILKEIVLECYSILYALHFSKKKSVKYSPRQRSIILLYNLYICYLRYWNVKKLLDSQISLFLWKIQETLESLGKPQKKVFL